MKNLTELTKDELIKLISDAKSELSKRNDDVKNPINVFELLNEQSKRVLSRYNGGWTKSIIGIDKQQTGGYSLKGEFIQGGINKKLIWKDGLYVDCDIQGSRKHQEKYYNLFKIENNKVILLHNELDSPDWAVNLWEKIEENL